MAKLTVNLNQTARRSLIWFVSGDKWKLHKGPEDSITDQLAEFQKLINNPPKGVDRIEQWTNTRGRTRRHQFVSEVKRIQLQAPQVSDDAKESHKKSK